MILTFVRGVSYKDSLELTGCILGENADKAHEGDADKVDNFKKLNFSWSQISVFMLMVTPKALKLEKYRLEKRIQIMQY